MSIESKTEKSLPFWPLWLGGVFFHVLSLLLIFGSYDRPISFGLVLYPMVWVFFYTIFGVYSYRVYSRAQISQKKWRWRFTGSILPVSVPIELMVVVGGFVERPKIGLWIFVCYLAGYIMNPILFLGHRSLAIYMLPERFSALTPNK